MSEEKVRGNPIIPPPPIPSQVRMSMLPEVPPPIPKEGGETPVAEDVISSAFDGEVVEKRVEEVEDEKAKGTITIRVYENSPYEVDFTGVITGSEIDIAWKAMMKGYRVWKHNTFKKQESESGGV